jgi:hypothetical protein
MKFMLGGVCGWVAQRYFDREKTFLMSRERTNVVVCCEILHCQLFTSSLPDITATPKVQGNQEHEIA